MKRDFTSLTPQQALQVAIFIEERNAEIYRQFAELFDQFGDPDSREIATVFTDMAEEELTHGTDLQERYVYRYGTRSCAITADEVEDMVELPQVPDGSIFAIARAGATTAPKRQALVLALAAEQTACSFYNFLVEVTEDEELANLYHELGAFEEDHVKLLERKLELLQAALKPEEA
ncbi:MAG: ferritin family protein [Terriglobales bacterium]